MFARFLLAALLILFFTGCATTTMTPSSQEQQLQNQLHQIEGRVAFLEEELQRKDQEISYLKNELKKTQEAKSSYKQSKDSNTKVQLSVRQIQTALKKAGFYRGSVDGRLGQQSKDAIKKFQKAKGLRVDGIVGNKTALALNRYLTK